MVFPLRRLLPWCKLSSTPFILCKLTNSLLNMHSSNNFVVVVRFALLAFLRIVLNSNLDCAKPSLASTQPYILKAGRSVYNFACSTAASIDYKFEFTIRSRASNSVHYMGVFLIWTSFTAVSLYYYSEISYLLVVRNLNTYLRWS